MVITKIKSIRGRRPRYCVYIDNRETLELSDWIIGKYGLRVGDEITDDKIIEINNAELKYQAKNVAINYLSYRARSAKEVMNHLIKKGFTQECANDVTNNLVEMGMIDDDKFAFKFIQDRLKRKHIGIILLKQQLIAKGISAKAADKIINELVTPNDQQDIALKTVKQKLQLLKKSKRKMDTEKIRARLLNFLIQRGFSYEIAIRTLNNVLGR